MDRTSSFETRTLTKPSTMAILSTAQDQTVVMAQTSTQVTETRVLTRTVIKHHVKSDHFRNKLRDASDRDDSSLRASDLT